MDRSLGGSRLDGSRPADAAALLLAWYDRHGRTLCFRGTHDPYAVWVSEIMLQQTRTETVAGYYPRFMARFPTVEALAAAPEEEVLKHWEGLGYYSRARNLHRAAKAVVAEYGGQFPRTAQALRALPGIGEYTAGAVASIAFGERVPALDGNLMRVLSRLHGVREDIAIPSVRRQLAALARDFLPANRPGDCNQALMDLGATVCVPGTPDCGDCPLAALCDAFAQGDAAALPVKSAARPPREVDVAVVLVTNGASVLVTRREESLLKGLYVFCLLENTRGKTAVTRALKRLCIRPDSLEACEKARHVFTHRVWNMQLYHCDFAGGAPPGYRFAGARELDALPFPTAMRAALARARALLAARA